MTFSIFSKIWKQKKWGIGDCDLWKGLWFRIFWSQEGEGEGRGRESGDSCTTVGVHFNSTRRSNLSPLQQISNETNGTCSADETKTKSTQTRV